MIAFSALPATAIARLRSGGLDAYGRAPERAISDGTGIPCRHCLHQVPAGASYLIVAWRPFPTLQPYAETGPIFLCADKCLRAEESPALPEILSSPDYIVRGYGPDDRIVYGTGQVTPTARIPEVAEALRDDPRVAYVHIRSARNNCYQVRIDRA